MNVVEHFIQGYSKPKHKEKDFQFMIDKRTTYCPSCRSENPFVVHDTFGTAHDIILYKCKECKGIFGSSEIIKGKMK